MKKSILLALFLMLASSHFAFADTIVHCCDAEGFNSKHNWGQRYMVHCCNPNVTTCTSKDAIIAQSPEKFSVGGNKSHDLKVQCNGNCYRVNNTSFDHSGGVLLALQMAEPIMARSVNTQYLSISPHLKVAMLGLMVLTASDF